MSVEVDKVGDARIDGYREEMQEKPYAETPRTTGEADSDADAETRQRSVPEWRRIRFVSKTAEGCVYSPSKECAAGLSRYDVGMDIEPPEIEKQRKKALRKCSYYMSKISVERGSRETEIGGAIVKSCGGMHMDYFAPVLEVVPLDFGEVEDDEISKCDIAARGKGDASRKADTDIRTGDAEKERIVSKKVRNVGKKTIYKALIEAGLSSPREMIRMLVGFHLHLLDAVRVLGGIKVGDDDVEERGVIHNNIRRASGDSGDSGFRDIVCA
jgi:hypothetical protein